MDLTLIVATVLVGFFVLVAFYLGKVFKGGSDDEGGGEAEAAAKESTKRKARNVSVCVLCTCTGMVRKTTLL